jgi:hypothetical protein
MEKALFYFEPRSVNQLKEILEIFKEDASDSYEIEKVIELEEGEDIDKILNSGADFLKENDNLMGLDVKRVWHCLLVKEKGQEDGILFSFKYSSNKSKFYAKFAAYWRNS